MDFTYAASGNLGVESPGMAFWLPCNRWLRRREPGGIDLKP